MQAVLLTCKYFQRPDKSKLQQQGSFTQIFNLAMVDSSLILDFALQEFARIRASNGAVRTAAWRSSALARALHT